MNSAIKRLVNELKEIQKDTNYYYSVCPHEDNYMCWDFLIIGPEDTIYEYGIFKGIINFPKEYPNRPPKVQIFNIIHPNIYTNGDVCISILHEGSDVYGYEKDIERWLPTHSVNSILLSIISMLSEPNFESPANINASTLWRNNPTKYKKDIYNMVKESQL